jgi:hypothetical protein
VGKRQGLATDIARHDMHERCGEACMRVDRSVSTIHRQGWMTAEQIADARGESRKLRVSALRHEMHCDGIYGRFLTHSLHWRRYSRFKPHIRCCPCQQLLSVPTRPTTPDRLCRVPRVLMNRCCRRGKAIYRSMCNARSCRRAFARERIGGMGGRFVARSRIYPSILPISKIRGSDV